MTLPLIYALSQVSKSESRRIRRIIAKDKKKKVQIQLVIDFVIEQGGIEYAKNKLKELHQQSKDQLEQIQAKGHKEDLMRMVDFVIERKK